ncbi:hypothetical protein B0T09DRAFT_405406 [Sordaria sp. MPI-SDFR-AT-0083]|nr:hypothetical protein B0T09DRAFT_405406 [Sordaria sp. MPI-SDFR-AT-0083]
MSTSASTKPSKPTKEKFLRIRELLHHHGKRYIQAELRFSPNNRPEEWDEIIKKADARDVSTEKNMDEKTTAELERFQNSGLSYDQAQAEITRLDNACKEENPTLSRSFEVADESAALVGPDLVHESWKRLADFYLTDMEVELFQRRGVQSVPYRNKKYEEGIESEEQLGLGETEWLRLQIDALQRIINGTEDVGRPTFSPSVLWWYQDAIWLSELDRFIIRLRITCLNLNIYSVQLAATYPHPNDDLEELAKAQEIFFTKWVLPQRMSSR